MLVRIDTGYGLTYRLLFICSLTFGETHDFYECNMFSNKKNLIPPRPHIPSPEHILEDLNHAAVNDVAFKIMVKGKQNSESLCTPNNLDDIYEKVKTFLSVKQQLKQLPANLKREEEQLLNDNNEIRRLADEIRKQAQAALLT